MKSIARFYFIFLSLILIPVSILSRLAVAQLNQAPIDSSKQAFEVHAAWSDVFKSRKNNVVQIITHARVPHLFEPYRQGEEFTAAGSGSFVKINGDVCILTNFHVIEGAQLILIQHPALGKEQFEVQFSGGCPDLDCALLSFSEDEHERIKELLDVSEISSFELGNSDDLTEGQEAMVIGYPLGQENVKSATGIISGRESTLSGEWITTTVPVNPGNSGGPFVNKDGKIIGICVARAGGDAQGIAYLIPINNARVMFNQFVDGKVVRTPFWGVGLTPMTKATINYLNLPVAGGGAYVTQVLKGSLGEKAGLQKGDIITHINKCEIDRFCDIKVPWTDYRISFIDLLMRSGFGEDVTFTVLRDGQSIQLSVSVSFERPFHVRRYFPPFDKMPEYEVFGGMVITEVTMNHVFVLMQGVIDPVIIKFLNPKNCYDSCLAITHVLPGSELDKVNIFGEFENRILSKINGKEVTSIKDFRKAILDHATDEHVVVECQGGALFALKLSDILRKEKIFARQKGYKLSDFYHELVRLRKGT